MAVEKMVFYLALFNILEERWWFDKGWGGLGEGLFFLLLWVSWLSILHHILASSGKQRRSWALYEVLSLRMINWQPAACVGFGAASSCHRKNQEHKQDLSSSHADPIPPLLQQCPPVPPPTQHATPDVTSEILHYILSSQLCTDILEIPLNKSLQPVASPQQMEDTTRILM